MKNMRVAIIDRKVENEFLYEELFRKILPLLKSRGIRLGRIQYVSDYDGLRRLAQNFLSGEKFLVISDTRLWDNRGYRTTLDVLEEASKLGHKIVIHSSMDEENVNPELLKLEDRTALGTARGKIKELVKSGACYVPKAPFNFSSYESFFSQVIEPALTPAQT